MDHRNDRLYITISLSFSIHEMERMLSDEFETYISMLLYRVKKVGEEALMEMPIGIMLINDEYYIEWTNPF